jgi:hypothetical protein
MPVRKHGKWGFPVADVGYFPDGRTLEGCGGLMGKATKENPMVSSIICGVDDSESVKGAAG